MQSQPDSLQASFGAAVRQVLAAVARCSNKRKRAEGRQPEALTGHRVAAELLNLLASYPGEPHSTRLQFSQPTPLLACRWGHLSHSRDPLL